MIELPEALILAGQMSREIEGKRIEFGNRGNTDHKFAFSNGSSEQYEGIFKGKTVGKIRGHGSAILVPVEPGYLLVLGGGGERILYHSPGSKLPKKTHLFLQFSDDSCLTVTVQGWGNTLLLPEETSKDHPHVQYNRIPPLSKEFTRKHFLSLFSQIGTESKTSAKHFLISKPGVWGIGNGCLQDILYHARIHPKRPMASLDAEEREGLFDAIIDTLQQMVDKGGRSDERDLYGNRGAYMRILDSKTKGKPCPRCDVPIEKRQYLGGAVYYCPACQPMDL